VTDVSLPERAAIERAMRREAEVGEQTLAPNRYVILVPPEEKPQLVGYVPKLAAAQRSFIDEQGWDVCDEVVVLFQGATDLGPGEFRVQADVQRLAGLTIGAGKGIGLLLGDGRRYTLQSGTTVIGRGRQADLVLRDNEVSRRHACLSYDGANVTLADLGSTNGTFLNDTPIDAEVPVAPGDTIRIGATTLTVATAR
jgi:hypothetical protein